MRLEEFCNKACSSRLSSAYSPKHNEAKICLKSYFNFTFLQFDEIFSDCSINIALCKVRLLGNFLQFGVTVHMICLTHLDLIVVSNAEFLDLNQDHLKIFWGDFCTYALLKASRR